MTSNVILRVEVYEPNCTNCTKLPAALEAPNAFSLPVGWQFIGYSWKGSYTSFGVTHHRYDVVLKPDPYSDGNASVRNAGRCNNSSPWNYTESFNFQIKRSIESPAIRNGTVTQSSVNLCTAGSSITLNAYNQFPVVTQYEWTATGGAKVNGSTIAYGTNVTVSATGSGNISVKATQSTCHSVSPITTIPVYYGSPVISSATVNGNAAQSSNYVSSGSAFLVINATNTASYNWVNVGGSGSIYPNSNSCNVSFSDFLRVEGIAQNSCGSSSYTFYLYKNAPYYYSVYPNPADETVTIDFTQVEGAEEQTREVVLRNEKGKELRKNSSADAFKSSSTNQSVKLDVHDLPRGRYFLHIKMGEFNTKEQLILK